VSYIKYKPEYAKEAEILCAELYATELQLAKVFEVDIMTIQAWKKKHKAFGEAVKRGKSEADAIIEQSLFRRAKGETYREKTITKKNKDGSWATMTERVVPPDTSACVKWLHNRRRDKWKPDQQIVEVVQPSKIRTINYIVDSSTANNSNDDGEIDAKQ